MPKKHNSLVNSQGRLFWKEFRRQDYLWAGGWNQVGLVQVPEFAEVKLPQSRWRLSGCAGRGWSSLEIPAERSVSAVPIGEKWTGSQGSSEKRPMVSRACLLLSLWFWEIKLSSSGVVHRMTNDKTNEILPQMAVRKYNLKRAISNVENAKTNNHPHHKTKKFPQKTQRNFKSALYNFNK